jgi:hypothetical protein
MSRPGTNLGVIYSDNDKTVWIRADQVPGIVTISSVQSTNLTCAELHKGIDLGAARNFLCSHDDPYLPASIGISFQSNTVPDPPPIRIPAMPKTTKISPQFDITGDALPPGSSDRVHIKQSASGTVTWRYTNSGYDHHFNGQYVTPTTVIGMQTRTLRQDSGPAQAGCETDMVIRLEVNGDQSFCEFGVIAPGTDRCDLPKGFHEKNCNYTYQ